MIREELKTKAELLRLMGRSYGNISKELNVAKSTLSYWFSRTSGYIGTSEKQIEHLRKARILSRLSLVQRGEKRYVALQKKVLENFSHRDSIEIFTKKIALSMLYWAEGTKHKKTGGLTFTNTDPMLIKVFASLLCQTFDIDKSKIKLRLAIHDYHNEKECKEFWSNLIGINPDQFHKTYLKPRSVTKKFRENFRGICFVYYPNSDIRREILEIGKQFCDYI